jgi:hypothetical protein
MKLKNNFFYIAAVLFCFLIFTTRSASAQSLSATNKQIWADFNPAYYFDKNFRLFGDIGIRAELEENGWWKFVFRPSVGGKLAGIFYYTAGVGSFYTSNQLIPNRWEIRPFQGLRFTLHPFKIPMSSYIRLEERFDFSTRTWNSVNSLRLRYQLSFSYRWAAIQKDRFWQASITGEAFFPLTGTEGQFREKFRLTIGVDRSFASSFHIRFELTAQQQQLFFDPTENISEVLFRIRLYHNWWRKE